MRARRPNPVFIGRGGAWLTGPPPPLLCLAVGLLGALAVGQAAMGATPLGSEFQVNTYTTGDQRYPSVAVDADGDFVVVWASMGSAGSDTDYYSIQGQRYDASGNALGSQFQVNTYTTANQGWSYWRQAALGLSAAVDADGDFVVAWGSYGSAGNDRWDYSVQGQRYDASGNAVGSEFQVNTTTTGYQLAPSVAVEADGDFVVVWQSAASTGSDNSSYSVQGQRYAANGSLIGSEFQVNTYTTGSQWGPSVAADANGNFAVVWSAGDYFNPAPDGSGLSVQGQRYAANGSAVGSEFQVNTFTTGQQWSPSLAVDADGNFVVVWNSYGSSGSDLDWSIQGQRYAANGNAVGSEFQVNTYTTHWQLYPSVAIRADGDFVVVWESYGSPGSDPDWSIQGQHYDASGNAVGAQFQVNTYTNYVQFNPSVAVEANGDFVVVWESIGSAGSDSDHASIQGQRYTVQAPQVPSFSRPGLIGLAVLLLGSAALMLRGRFGGRA